MHLDVVVAEELAESIQGEGSVRSPKGMAHSHHKPLLKACLSKVTVSGSFVFAFPSLNWTSTGGTFNRFFSLCQSLLTLRIVFVTIAIFLCFLSIVCM